MLLKSHRKLDGAYRLTEQDVTPKSMYIKRRTFMSTLGVGLAAMALPLHRASAAVIKGPNAAGVFAQAKETAYDPGDDLTPYDAVTEYNNFYEFGTGKSDPVNRSGHFVDRPWRLTIDGMVHNPMTLDVDDLIAKMGLEERIYRFRCVEAWSMVIPWIGFGLADLVKLADPLGSARYVRFETLMDPAQFPAQTSKILPWPYVEGLRLDEALNPLAFMAVGLYGETLPAQNGAPIRLVVPWKYGFKSIKSIVKISFVAQEPLNTWQILSPQEYGFYANVNPTVDHPRWSQSRERRIGDFFRRRTLMFNGYAEQVAHLYEGMDLAKYY
jgi:sulfoxide reductase catalytic subunit YedY